MNYLDLAEKPLDYQQKAPIGFLWTVKFLINLFGKSEYTLRLLPLISGILSMFFFIPVIKFFLKGYGVFLASALLALAPAMIYHTVEIKQYSTELFCTILAFYFLINYKESIEIRQKFYWGISGAILLWYSYSVIFILSGFGFALSLYYLYKKSWKLFFLNSISFLIWFLSFLINYLFFIKDNPGAKWVVYWFNFYGNFMPFPPKSLSDLNWFILSIYRMLDYPMGLLWNFINISSNHLLNQLFKMPVLPFFFMIAGSYALYKSSKQKFLIAIIPVGFVFIASGLKYYPLTERFWVFIIPVFIILLAKGFEYIQLRKLKTLIFVLLLTGPVYQSFSSISHPENFYMHKKSFQKEALNYINNNFRKDDAVYIYWNELPGYKVYKNLYTYKFSAIEGNDFRKISKDFSDYNMHLNLDLKRLNHKKRVWLIFNHKYLANVGDLINDPSWYYQSGLNPTKNLESEFLKIGFPVKKIVYTDVTVYLFDLKNINH